QATEGAHPGAGAHYGHSAANAIARNQTAGKVAEIGGDKRHPGKQRNSLQTETARIAQVLGQPGNVKPPDGIGERAAQNNAPDISIPGEFEPTPRAALWRN